MIWFLLGLVIWQAVVLVIGAWDMAGLRRRLTLLELRTDVLFQNSTDIYGRLEKLESGRVSRTQRIPTPAKKRRSSRR